MKVGFVWIETAINRLADGETNWKIKLKLVPRMYRHFFDSTCRYVVSGSGDATALGDQIADVR